MCTPRTGSLCAARYSPYPRTATVRFEISTAPDARKSDKHASQDLSSHNHVVTMLILEEEANKEAHVTTCCIRIYHCFLYGTSSYLHYSFTSRRFTLVFHYQETTNMKQHKKYGLTPNTIWSSTVYIFVQHPIKPLIQSL